LFSITFYLFQKLEFTTTRRHYRFRCSLRRLMLSNYMIRPAYP
jgi:hypothetical protein